MNRIVVIAGVLAVLALVAFFVLFTQLGPIITRAVEHFGSEMTQASVTLDKAEISATSGAGALHGLTVGNPKDFESESALKFPMVRLSVDPASLTEPTVVVREVVIAGPEITYELGGGGSNIAAIKKNIDAYVKSAGLAGEKKAKPDGKGGKKMVIEKLSVRDGKIYISATLLKGGAMTVKLPDVELRDIGKSSGGASPGEVAKRVMTAIGGGVKKAVGGLDSGGVKDAVKGVASGVQKELEKGLGASVGTLGKAGEDVGGAVKDLFGK